MNKLTKLLSVFVIAGAVAGAGAIAGCGHKHTFSDELTNNDPEGHYYAATCEHGGEKKDFEVHVYDNDKDTDCNTCGYVRTVSGGEENPNPENPNPEKPTPEKPTPEQPDTEIKVSFNLNGHGTGTIEDAVADANGKITAPESPTDAEYNFLGWTLEGEEEILDIANIKFEESTTLFATWELKNGQENPPTPAKKYSITYIINGHGTQPDNVAEASALPAQLPDLTAEGWTFEGWYLDDEFQTKAKPGATLSANATLYAKWTEEQGQVTPPVVAYKTVYENDYRGEGVTVKEGTANFPTEDGVYKFSQTKSGETSDGLECNVTVDGNTLKIVDKSATDTTFGYISIERISLKKVSIEFSVSLSKQSGKWTPVRIVDENGKNIVALRTDKDKKICLTNDDNVESVTDGFAYAATTEIKVALVLDLATGKATGSVIQGDKSVEYSGDKAIDISATSVGGVKFQTATDAREITLNSLVVKTMDVSIADVQKVLGDKLDAEYAKYATNYTENKTIIDAAYNTGKDGITAADATVASAVEACNTAIAAMTDVLSDADISLEATATDSAFNKALAEINAEKAKRTLANVVLSETVTITGNKAAVDAIDLTLDKTVITTYSKLKEWKEGKLAAITAIDDDSAIITAVKTKINENVDAIAVAENAKLQDSDAKKTEKENAITAAVTAIKGEVTAENDVDKLLAILNDAESRIQKAVSDQDKTVEQLRAEYEALLDTYAAGKYTEDSEEPLKTAVQTALAKAKAMLVGTEENPVTTTNIGNKFEDAKKAIDKAVTDYEAAKVLNAAKDTAKSDIESYKTTELAKLHGAEATLFDGVDCETDINAAKNTDELQAAINKITGEINKVINAFKAQVFAIEVVYSGNTYSTIPVQYGTKLTFADIKITGFTVTGAEIAGEAIPADGVEIYENKTVTVTGIQQGNGVSTTQATWTAPNAFSNDLFTVSLPANARNIAAGDTTTGTNKFASVKIGSTTYTNVNYVYQVGNGENNENAPIVIYLSAALKSLSISTALTQSDGTKDRTGTTHYIVNGTEVHVDNKINLSYTLQDLEAGSVVEIYVENTGSGGMLLLAQVDAEIDVDKSMPKTVNVTWQGGKDGEFTESATYLTDFELPDEAEYKGSFKGWFYTVGGVKTQFTGGTLTGGTYTIVAEYEYNLVVNYVENAGEDPVTLYFLVDAENTLASQMIEPAGDATNVFTGWKDGNDADVTLDEVTAGTVEAPAEITLKAQYQTVTAVDHMTVTIDGEENTTAQITAGGNVKIVAKLYDTESNEITDRAAKIAITGSGATLADDGTLTCTDVGTVTVKVTFDTFETTLTITVKSAYSSWNLDFENNKVTADSSTIAVGTVIGGVLTVVDMGNTIKIASGSLTATFKSNKTPVLSFEVSADAKFAITLSRDDTSRGFIIRDTEGNEVITGSAKTTKQEFDIKKGSYTIEFNGGEHKIKNMSLIYGS